MSVGLQVKLILTLDMIMFLRFIQLRVTIAINSHETITTLRKLHLDHEQIPKQNGHKTTLKLIFYEQNP